MRRKNAREKAETELETFQETALKADARAIMIPPLSDAAPLWPRPSSWEQCNQVLYDLRSTWSVSRSRIRTTSVTGVQRQDAIAATQLLTLSVWQSPFFLLEHRRG